MSAARAQQRAYLRRADMYPQVSEMASITFGQPGWHGPQDPAATVIQVFARARTAVLHLLPISLSGQPWRQSPCKCSLTGNSHRPREATQARSSGFHPPRRRAPVVAVEQRSDIYTPRPSDRARLVEDE